MQNKKESRVTSKFLTQGKDKGAIKMASIAWKGEEKENREAEIGMGEQ